MLVLKNASVLGEDFRFQNTDVVIEDGVITSVGATGLPGIDLQGQLLVPGLVDIHTHGCAGGDHLDGTPEATGAICRWMAQHGTTSLLATIMTQSPDVMLKAAENVAQYSNDPEGAHIRGIYLEGPFFCDQYKGAQHPQHLRLPEQSFLDKLQKASNHQVKALSLAPELPDAIDFIRQQKQMRIFMGHTASDYATAVAAIEAGATGLTHSFNAMTPLHHRKPGILAAAMEAPSVFCECICDGFHVHPAMVALLYRQVGRERFCVISDSLRPTGLPDGAYTSGGQPITVSDGKAYLENGTIAGSTSHLLDEVRNLVRWGICSVEDSVYAASAVPAKAVGIYDTVGSIAPGKAADLLVLDKNLQLQQVYIAGNPLSQK